MTAARKPPVRSGPSLTNAERFANGKARLAGIWLEAEVVEALDAEADATGSSRTALIDQALRRLLRDRLQA